MNSKKMTAAAVSAVIAATMISSAVSADFKVTGAAVDDSGMELVMVTPGSWMPIVYNDGSRNSTVADDANKAVIDYGIDWTKAASIEVVFHITEETRPDWDGMMWGAVILSSNSKDDDSHNWPKKEFYGITDAELDIDTRDPDKELNVQPLGDYSYKITCPIDDTNSVVDDSVLVQISFSDYSTAAWWEAQVDSMSVLAADGSKIIEWDGLTGEAQVYSSAVSAETDADNAAAEDADAAPDGAKGSPDTGIPDVVAAAGIGILAAGAAAIAKKRK
ncbi:MAG: hypothetical protein J6X60_04170 [Ruminiclostridium sp.]|nr:hypothetical protein [Ruminiclostridium sp.]